MIKRMLTLAVLFTSIVSCGGDSDSQQELDDIRYEPLHFLMAAYENPAYSNDGSGLIVLPNGDLELFQRELYSSEGIELDIPISNDEINSFIGDNTELVETIDDDMLNSLNENVVLLDNTTLSDGVSRCADSPNLNLYYWSFDEVKNTYTAILLESIGSVTRKNTALEKTDAVDFLIQKGIDYQVINEGVLACRE